MNILLDALNWFFDPAHWTGPNGLTQLTIQHLWISALALAITAVLALPAGWVIGHTGRGAGALISLTGAARAIPTLGVISLVGVLWGIGLLPPMIALVILALPSVLVGTYSAIESIPHHIIDAARAQGFTTAQIMGRVHLPLGLARMIGGLRLGFVQIMATAMLAAYVGAGGLGRFIFLGLKTQNYAMMLASSLWVIVLILMCDGIAAGIQRLAVPAGVRHLVKESAGA